MNNTSAITITNNGKSRPFYFRPQDKGDLGAIRQVLEMQDYNLDHFAQGVLLRDWAQKQKSPLVIIDAGAHIGTATIWYSMQFPGTRIIAVEPEDSNFDLLRKNLEGAVGVTLVHGAIGSYDGTGFLSDPGHDSWGFRVASVAPGTLLTDVPVDMHTMRSLLKMEPDCVPFIAKIDIEGGERDLFSHNAEWLLSFPLIIIELHDWMLVGQASSRNFLQAISVLGSFDIICRGENMFCFNNALLGG